MAVCGQSLCPCLQLGVERIGMTLAPRRDEPAFPGIRGDRPSPLPEAVPVSAPSPMSPEPLCPRRPEGWSF